MPEEIEVETRDLQETLDELHREREERQHEEKQTAWTRYIALSTALMAVVAAIAALESGYLVNEALIERQNAAIEQSRASDAWSYYQAKDTDAVIARAAADLSRSIARSPAGPAMERTFIAERNKYLAKKGESRAEAGKHEHERDLDLQKSDTLLHRHHDFAYSVTLTQIAIALAAVAALTRRKPVWVASVIVGSAGLILLVQGFARAGSV